MNLHSVGDGKVVLISGGGKIYTDIAARFVRSERSLDEILASPYDKKIVNNILEGGHLAATEFDYFIFGIEGYSRVTEIQLVRKRIASYLIKSGRTDKSNRSFDMVIPDDITKFNAFANLPAFKITGPKWLVKALKWHHCNEINFKYNTSDLFMASEELYEYGKKAGIPEEDLRYTKPQATEFKAIIGMNAHALMDWFRIRECKNAQAEIRDLATKMHHEVMKVAPDLFKDAGPNCKVLGYCPEGKYQNKECKGKIPTKEEALKIIHDNYNKKNASMTENLNSVKCNMSEEETKDFLDKIACKNEDKETYELKATNKVNLDTQINSANSELHKNIYPKFMTVNDINPLDPDESSDLRDQLLSQLKEKNKE
jgi:thymidylate synthase (FAD)